MTGLPRWLTAFCVALLAAGAGGVVTHREPGRGAAATQPPASRPAPTSPASTRPAPTTAPVPAPTVPPGPAAGSATLAAGMITPTDMGGYYRVDPATAVAITGSAPCLAGLEPSASQAGRAETALLGPDEHSVPTIVELAASYPGQEPATIYREVATAVNACPAFGLTFGGTRIEVPLKPLEIPPVGLADSAWSGIVGYAGTNLQVQLGVVLDGHIVLSLMWIDSDPPSAAIMGNFSSTLSAAIGKLA